MKRIFITLLLLFLFCAKCYKKRTAGPNPDLVNGDFNEDLTIGWQKKIENYAGGYEIKRVKEGEEYYVRVNKDLCGYAQLFQIVKITNLASSLSFQAKFSANTNEENYAAAAAVVVEYLNHSQRRLGATYFYYSTSNFWEWQNSSTTHIYKTSASGWQTFSLDIKNELGQNLPNINSDEVVYLKISLLAYCTQEEGC